MLLRAGDVAGHRVVEAFQPVEDVLVSADPPRETTRPSLVDGVINLGWPCDPGPNVDSIDPRADVVPTMIQPE